MTGFIDISNSDEYTFNIHFRLNHKILNFKVSRLFSRSYSSLNIWRFILSHKCFTQIAHHVSFWYKAPTCSHSSHLFHIGLRSWISLPLHCDKWHISSNHVTYKIERLTLDFWDPTFMITREAEFLKRFSSVMSQIEWSILYVWNLWNKLNNIPEEDIRIMCLRYIVRRCDIKIRKAYRISDDIRKVISETLTWEIRNIFNNQIKINVIYCSQIRNKSSFWNPKQLPVCLSDIRKSFRTCLTPRPNVNYDQKRLTSVINT